MSPGVSLYLQNVIYLFYVLSLYVDLVLSLLPRKNVYNILLFFIFKDTKVQKHSELFLNIFNILSL